jgi:uncharacterized delta-60 repeat protein
MSIAHERPTRSAPVPRPRLAAALILGLALAMPLEATEPPDGTVLLANYSAFDLDANAGDVVTSADVAPDGKLVVAGYAHDGTNLWVLVVSRYLTNGQLDTTFGSGGRVVDPLNAVGLGYSSYARAVKVLADGRIVVGGSLVAPFNITVMMALRLTASGALDTSFGGGGVTTVNYGLDPNEVDEANAMAIDRSGRIVLAGSIDVTPGNRDIGVVRLTPSGQLDTNFGFGGLVEVAFDYSGPNLDLGFGVAVAPSGKIVVGGTTRYQPSGGPLSFNFAIAQLLPDGSLDAGFGNNGHQIAAFDHGGTNNDIIRSVAVDDRNRILVGGESARSSGVWDYAVARFLPNGAPDTSFNSVGFRFDTFSCSVACGERDSVHSIALQGDGKILLAGPTYTTATGNYDFGVSRLLADGTLDTHFGNGGRFHYNWNHGAGNDDDTAEAVVLGKDGRILVAGTIEYNFPDTDWGHMTLANHYIFGDGFGHGTTLAWSTVVP